MRKMVMFRLSRECREIAVNPASVLYVCHYDHGASSLHFSKDCFVRVQGELAEVVRKLEDGPGEPVPDRSRAAGERPGRGPEMN